MSLSCAEHKQECRPHIFSVRVSNLGFKNAPGVTALTYGTTAYYEGWNFNSGNYLFTTDTK